MHKPSKKIIKKLSLSIVWGSIGSIFNLIIVALLSRFQDEAGHYGLLPYGMAFIGSIVIYVVCDNLSLRNGTLFTNLWIAELRSRLHASVLATSWSDFCHRGSKYFHTLLSDDIQKVEQFSQQVPLILTDILKTFMLFTYMLVIFPVPSLIFIGMMSLVFIIITIFEKHSQIYHQQTRDVKEHATQHVIDSIQGFRELKVDPRRCKKFMQHQVTPGIDKLYRFQSRSWLWDNQNNSIFWLGLYLVIGTVMLGIYFSKDTSPLSFIIVMMMVISPFATIIMSLPLFIAAKVAHRNIESFIEEGDHPDQDHGLLTLKKGISLVQLGYEYPGENGVSGFKLCDINADFLLGSINFIIGGNGSGKSSLISLLTGLVLPSEGYISFDHIRVCDQNLSSFQSGLSVIYQNPYVFSQNTTFNSQEKLKEFECYLEQFFLKDKINLKNGIFEGLDKLSFGQKKRLGLICALLEDKDVYIFDEWAADQDPYFRRLFYTEILTDLRSKGKLVIAITHDHEYFQIADTVLTMHQGRGDFSVNYIEHPMKEVAV